MAKSRKIVITENGGFIYVMPLRSFAEDEILEFDGNVLEKCKAFPKHVVLDLLNVNYLYSNGINSFIRCYKVLHEIKKEVVIFNASDMVENVLRSVNLNKIIPILYSFDAFYQWQASKAGVDMKSGLFDFKLEQRGKIAVLFPGKAGNISSLEMRPDFQKISAMLVSPLAVIDLSQISDFNTIMLSSLAVFANELQEKGGKLVFSGLDATSQELFSLLDVDNNFDYSDNVEKAVDSLG